MKPARDLGLAPGERLRSQAREAGLGGTLLQGAWRRMLRGYLRAAHALVVEGRENLPAAPPFVLVANHCSHLDALTLSAVLGGEAARRAHVLAAGDYFFGNAAAAAFAAYAVNALPVWRRRTGRRDIATLRERLAQDRLVYILFPEGTRSRDGRMGHFQPGLGALVAGTHVPVVPCHLHGAHAAWPAGRSLPRPGPLRLVIGAPADFAGLGNDRAGWEEVARRCEASVLRLGGTEDGAP